MVTVEGEEVQLYMDQYHDGNRAIVAYGVYGEPFGRLSVNLDIDPPEHGFWIKAWSENESLARAAWASGVFVVAGETSISTPGGKVRVEAWKILW
jgi:hypothetical protein